MPARGSKQTLEKKNKPKYRKIDTTTLPPLYKCSCCGKVVQEPEGKFFKVIQNSLYNGNDGFSTVCTYCCDDFFRSSCLNFCVLGFYEIDVPTIETTNDF